MADAAEAAEAADPTLEEFRAEVRSWLEAQLGDGGPFADVRGTGGPGREHEHVERRREWERRLGADGWIGLGWPVSAGGRGLSLAHQVVFHEEYARAGGPGRLMHMSEQLLAPTVLAFGTAEQQAAHLPGILRGETLWCQGYSEPGAGSDLAGVATRAVRDGDDYVLTGQKVWTSLAHVADWCFVLARTEAGSARHTGLSFLLVPMDQPGIEVRPIVQITGTSEFNEVFFDGARTSTANRVGGEGDGWRIAMALLGFERGVSTLGQQIGFEREYAGVLAAALAAGDARAGLVADASGAAAAGGGLAPGLRERLTQSWLDLLVVRAVGETTLRSSGQGAAGLEASISKLLWATWHRDLGELALDVQGLRGLAAPAEGEVAPEVAEAQNLFLFTRSDTIYGGSNEIQRNILAERLLGMPKEGSDGARQPQRLAPQWNPSDVLVTGETGQEIRGALRSVLTERVPRPVRRFDASLQRTLLDDLGVGTALLPDSLGGLGLTWAEAGLTAWELGTHLTATALLDTITTAGWLAESARAGSLVEGAGAAAPSVATRFAEQQPLVALVGLTGDHVAGSSLAATASDDGSRATLNGWASLTPWAGRADWLLAPIDGQVWLVEVGAAGVSVQPREPLDPTRELADVEFDHAEAVLIPGDGDLLLARARTMAALEASGTAYRALMETVGYLGERRQFGRFLASYQALKHRCADLVVRVAGASALAAQSLARPELAAAAKVVASDALVAVAAEALQLHGGVGFTDEYDVHLYLRRGKATQHLWGANSQVRASEFDRAAKELA